MLPGARAEPHVDMAARRLAELLPHGAYDDRATTGDALAALA